jgi:hypothetical protein
LGVIVGKKLERDKATKLHTLGLVDHAHSAAAESLDEAVVRDSLADHVQALGLKRNTKDVRKPSQRSNQPTATATIVRSISQSIA